MHAVTHIKALNLRNSVFNWYRLLKCFCDSHINSHFFPKNINQLAFVMKRQCVFMRMRLTSNLLLRHETDTGFIHTYIE
jgi:hypothetical protein